MGTSNPQTREAMSRLALSCSALARAGQVLSMVTDPAKTNEALRQAASMLDSDAKASRLPQMEAAALECQSALNGVAEGERVAVCRKLATKLARLASTLATEVQEQTRKTGKVEARPAAPAPGTPAVARAPESVPAVAAHPTPKEPSKPSTRRPESIPAAPVAKPAPAVAPVPVSKPAQEKRPAKPRIDITRIRVAASDEERVAVTAALEAGLRFAVVKNGTLIDTRMNLMWAAKSGPPGSHKSAIAYAGQCRLGGYADWRLPRPEELQHFLTGGGRDAGSTTLEGGGVAAVLWTCETSRRWFFIRQATVVRVGAGSVDVVSAGRGDVHVLVVRSA